MTHATPGEPRWHAVLAYTRDLHRRSTRPAQPPFPHAWEEIGPGYCYGPAFGHWDIVHQIMDALVDDPAHARRQLLNNFANQQADGMLPGSIWMRDTDMPWSRADEAGSRWNRDTGHPPVWPVAVEDYVACTGDQEMLHVGLAAARRQLAWFEAERRVRPEGFYYNDITIRRWESGVDEGIRFDEAPTAPMACVDATSHVYLVYDCATAWAERLGEDAAGLRARRDSLGAYLREALFAEATRFFHDAWSVTDPARRRLAQEGMWPVVVGAATPEQAQRVITEHLLNPEGFFTPHPLATVSRRDPGFSLRMWRGPAWNSMTYWAARGCLRYGHTDAARALLAAALDATAEVFARTGTIWEFYHPLGGDPDACQRKPHTRYNAPCRDYLGHNPLLAMARLYDITA